MKAIVKSQDAKGNPTLVSLRVTDAEGRPFWLKLAVDCACVGHDVTFGKGEFGARCSTCHADCSLAQIAAIQLADHDVLQVSEDG